MADQGCEWPDHTISRKETTRADAPELDHIRLHPGSHDDIGILGVVPLARRLLILPGESVSEGRTLEYPVVGGGHDVSLHRFQVSHVAKWRRQEVTNSI